MRPTCRSSSILRAPLMRPVARASLIFQPQQPQQSLPLLPTTHRPFSATATKWQPQVKVMATNTTDPLFNLATEEWIFKDADLSQQTLYLWRNAPTVIIGRHQNPFKECHLQAMEKENVTLARRYSGGGAVYQDLGNTCFTFLSPVSSYDKSRNTAIITKALQNRFGITATASGRNDILVDGKKISGSAYKLSGGRALHHGTLLINVDFNALGRYLNPDKAKLKSKGVASVQARVQNLKELDATVEHESICEAIVKQFFSTYDDSCEIEYLKYEQLASIPSLASTYRTLQDWKWRFGETPEFEHSLEKRFDWGNIDLNINSKDGLITEVKVFSDSLYPQMIDELTLSLRGCTYDKQGIITAIEDARVKLRDVEVVGDHLNQLREWLLSAL